MQPSRREFLKSAMAAGACQALLPALLFGQDTAQGDGFRTITYNILKAHGYSPVKAAEPFIKAAAGQMPTRLAFELALYQPDIISFQEAPPEPVVKEIAAQLKLKYAFFQGGWNGALLSRFEISQAQNCPLVSWPERPKDLFTRHWGRAILHAPGRDIHFFSAHLHPSDDAVREREVTEMLKVMEPTLKSGEAILFQGDLNHPPSGPGYPRWVNAGFIDLYLKHKAHGDAEFSITSADPTRRIDFIWANQPLANRSRDCRILFEGAFRTNLEDPRSFALSDHLPVTAGFR